MRITRFIREKDAETAANETLHTAAARLRTTGLSCLPVMAGGQVIALITGRDLVKAMALCDRPGEARVGDYMRTGPITVAPDEEAAVALMRMMAIGCLDLPVVSGRRFVGTVSARELLAAQAVVQGVAV